VVEEAEGHSRYGGVLAWARSDGDRWASTGLARLKSSLANTVWLEQPQEECAVDEKGGASRGRKLIGRNRVNLIVCWSGRFLFFVCEPPQGVNNQPNYNELTVGVDELVWGGLADRVGCRATHVDHAIGSDLLESSLHLDGREPGVVLKHQSGHTSDVGTGHGSAGDGVVNLVGRLACTVDPGGLDQLAGRSNVNTSAIVGERSTRVLLLTAGRTVDCGSRHGNSLRLASRAPGTGVGVLIASSHSEGHTGVNSSCSTRAGLRKQELRNLPESCC